MIPRVSALLDQADAAAADGARMFAMLADHTGSPIRWITGPEDVGDTIRAIVSRFTGRAASGQLTLCPHLSGSAPVPVFWLAWAPGRIRCSPCMGSAGRRIKGTAEDRRCDHCRRKARAIHCGGMQLPAIVVNLPGLLAASGPVTVMFGLCPACRVRAMPPEAHADLAAV
jgi:hypothetical protein